ncbi:MAG: hypothetical protein ACREGC_02355, partial [Minisyncoccia bacterium]
MQFDESFQQKMSKLDSVYSFTNDEKTELWQRVSADRSWDLAWAKYAEANKRALSARYVINISKKKDSKTAWFDNAEQELACDLKKALPIAEK